MRPWTPGDPPPPIPYAVAAPPPAPPARPWGGRRSPDQLRQPLEQFGGLGADDGQILILVVSMFFAAASCSLLLRDDGGGGRENLESAEVSDLHHHAEGLPQQKSPTSTLARCPT